MSDPYHVRLPKWPSFTWSEEEKEALPTDFEKRREQIDGDLPATRVDSWRDFHRLVEDNRFSNDEFIFRGQHRNDWDLVPSLARGSDRGIFTPKQAKRSLESFRRASRGRKDLDPMLDEDLEMWALGQHHGLKTPLLDWTLSPYVALFFAFERPDATNVSPTDSRVVFALNKTRVEGRVTQLLRDGSREDQVVRIFQPAGDSNRRLLSQAGIFLAVPPNESVTSWILTNLGQDIEGDDDVPHLIMKIHIPNKDREECLRSLHRMNIHHASLFPDLIGSSSYTNFEFEVYRPDAHPGGGA